MTASSTPRLGLMLPAGSDNFTIADFDTTFTILDGQPGIKPVANYSALPSGLTSAQHGSIYLQLDNGSLWMWKKPGAPAGAWVKLNNVGLIQNASQSSTTTTSATDPNLAPAMVNTSFTFPGGRAVLCYFFHSAIRNSGGYGYSVVDLWINGVATTFSIMSGGATGKSITHNILYGIGPTFTTPGSTVTVKATVRSTTSGGGQTIADPDGQLYIWEI